jgi:hypothetical protein
VLAGKWVARHFIEAPLDEIRHPIGESVMFGHIRITIE